MQQLIYQLREELYSKPSPGKVLNDLFEGKLKELEEQYKEEVDHEALWIGSYIADLFIFEAKETGNIKEHVPMAVDYANKIIDEHNIDPKRAEIIIEIIETHHGGAQRHLESKLYKNADCYKFLLPQGAFHIFSAFYKNEPENLDKAMEMVIFKANEKYNLVNLNAKLKAEAEELYKHWEELFARTKYKVETPELYK